MASLKVSTSTDLNVLLKMSDNLEEKSSKGLGGEISVPTPETNDNLKEKLKLKIQQGEFTVGELIVPREASM